MDGWVESHLETGLWKRRRRFEGWETTKQWRAETALESWAAPHCLVPRCMQIGVSGGGLERLAAGALRACLGA